MSVAMWAGRIVITIYGKKYLIKNLLVQHG